MILRLTAEYGIWQLISAFSLFVIGTTLHTKSAGGKRVGIFCGVLGALYCTDELLMGHECADQLLPRGLFLGIELLGSAMVAVFLLKKRVLNLKLAVATVFLGLASAVAWSMDIWGDTYPQQEELLETICVLSGVVLATLIPGEVPARKWLRNAGIWSVVIAIFGGLFLYVRPSLCPKVDAWGKKYFFEQMGVP